MVVYFAYYYKSVTKVADTIQWVPSEAITHATCAGFSYFVGEICTRLMHTSKCRNRNVFHEMTTQLANTLLTPSKSPACDGIRLRFGAALQCRSDTNRY